MEYCCEMMDYHVNKKCPQHSSPYDCPDNVIVHNEKKNYYGLIIHDGGPSSYEISFCPWCGKDLKKD